MDPITIAIIGVAAMLLLIAAHIPLGVAMALVGLGGTYAIIGWAPAISQMATIPATNIASLDLVIIPMFLLMGSVAARGGLAMDIYNIANAFIGHRRGGLATATVMGCAGFGAICGSGIATTATFSRVALPEMLKRGYAPSLATGTIAAGGTLGIIIPPSSILIIYGLLTEQSVLHLFTAAFVPAAIAVAFYWLAVQYSIWRRPEDGPAAEKMAWPERLKVMSGGWAALLLAFLVLGGIYSGIFTVNEAAAVGVVVALAIVVSRGRLGWRDFKSVLIEASAATAMIYLMIFGAQIFSTFLALTGAPALLVNFIGDLGLHPMIVITLLLVFYLVLGAVFDEVASMIITLPFVVPLIMSFGYDLIWWGVINVVIIELGMIIPPIGISVMVLNSMNRSISLRTIYAGITPFIAVDIVRLALLVAFPSLILWLPTVLH